METGSIISNKTLYSQLPTGASSNLEAALQFVKLVFLVVKNEASFNKNN
jgi:hypothetical protein